MYLKIKSFRFTTTFTSALALISGSYLLCAQKTKTEEVNNNQGANEPNGKLATETNPLTELKKINETTYQLGEVTIDKAERSISFNATSEITAALVEYAIVNPQGKIHEALFVTKARPLHLNIAFKLLGFQENKSLFREFVNDLPTENFQKATAEQKAKSYFSTTISWTDKKTKKKISYNLNELLMNAQTKKPLGPAKWSYGGSFMHRGQFVAELNHDVIAIFTDRGALANYAGKGREDDTLWFPVTEKMPAPGTEVSITIKPEFPAGKNKNK